MTNKTIFPLPNIVRMKLIFAYILLPVLSYGQPIDTVGIHDLDEDRGGIFYKSGKLFTGVGVKYYYNGQKSQEENYKDGKKEGRWTEYYESGLKKEEGNRIAEYDYSDSTNFPLGRLLYLHSNGLHTKWYENGQKEEEGNYVMGKETGLWMSWYESGELRSEIQYVGNEVSHAIFWYKNGQKEREAFFTGNESGYRETKWTSYGMEIPQLGDSVQIQILWVIILYVLILSPFWIIYHVIRIIRGRLKWSLSHLGFYLIIIGAFLFFTRFSSETFVRECQLRIGDSIPGWLSPFIMLSLALVFGIRHLKARKGKRLSAANSVKTFFVLLTLLIIIFMIFILYAIFSPWRPNG